MSYQVTIQPSGRTFTVAEGESVLDAALRQGVILPYSCRSGTCATCAAQLVSGEIEYPNGTPPALSEAAATSGQALLCQARPSTDLVIKAQELEGVADIPARRLPARVVRVEQLAHDVRRLYLKTPPSQRMQFLAGQYIDILLKNGRRRAFSLANAPHDDELLELHVRMVEGGEFTHYVFTELKEKALLRLEGPLGTFFLREDSSRPILMIGGGTGFAPLKGMIEHAFHLGIDRPIHLFWGVRARRDLYLDALPRAWERQHSNFRYTPVLSEPLPEDQWDGPTGWVHEEAMRQHPNLGDYDIYMSGPPAMIYAARDAFVAHGAKLEQIYSDAFEYAHVTGG